MDRAYMLEIYVTGSRNNLSSNTLYYSTYSRVLFLKKNPHRTINVTAAWIISDLVKQGTIHPINDTYTSPITHRLSLASCDKREDPSSQVRKSLSYNDATNKKNLQNLLPVILRL